MKPHLNQKNLKKNNMGINMAINMAYINIWIYSRPIKPKSWEFKISPDSFIYCTNTECEAFGTRDVFAAVASPSPGRSHQKISWTGILSGDVARTSNVRTNY